MKNVKSFIWLNERKEDSELLTGMGSEALGMFDRIMMNNMIELQLQSNADKIYLFEEETALDEIFRTEQYKEVFTFFPRPAHPMELAGLIGKQLQKEEKFIISKGNSFGFHPALYSGLKNYLEIEEDVCVLYSSSLKQLCAIGATRFEDSLLGFLQGAGTQDEFVFGTESPDRFYIFLNNLCLVDTIADFRELYRQLSHRENIHLCSKYFYDQFTEIFIEFRELLK